MAIIFTKISYCYTLPNLPKLGFFGFKNIPSGNPGADLPVAGLQGILCQAFDIVLRVVEGEVVGVGAEQGSSVEIFECPLSTIIFTGFYV
jgi:hypothetical protein